MLVKFKDFEKEISGHKEILVLFYAEWCGYCARFRPCFKDISEKCKTICATVDISDEENPLWEKLSIERVPTIILYRMGKIIDRKSGGLEQAELETFMKKNNLN